MIIKKVQSSFHYVMVAINISFFFSSCPPVACLENLEEVLFVFFCDFRFHYRVRRAFIIYSYSLPFGAHEKKEFFIGAEQVRSAFGLGSNRVSSSKPFLIIQSSDRCLGVARAKLSPRRRIFWTSRRRNECFDLIWLCPIRFFASSR
jgi:hypothetical protein